MVFEMLFWGYLFAVKRSVFMSGICDLIEHIFSVV